MNILTFEEFLNESSLNEKTYRINARVYDEELTINGRSMLKEIKKGSTLGGMVFARDGKSHSVGGFDTTFTVTKIVDVKSSNIFGIYEVDVTSTEETNKIGTLNTYIKPDQTYYVKLSFPVSRSYSQAKYKIECFILENPKDVERGALGFNVDTIEI